MGACHEVVNELVPAVADGNNLLERFAYAAPRQAASALITTGVGIAAGQDLKDALLQNIRLAAAGVVSSACASEIGSQYAQEKIDPVTHKLLHAGTGAVTGAILGGKSGAIAGGAGALVAETIADVFAPKKPTLDSIMDLQVQKGRQLTHDEFSFHWNSQLQKYAQSVSNVEIAAKMTTAIAALAGRQDVHTANFTATTAIDNNFLVLAGYGLAAAGTAYSAYNIYNAYEQGGPVDALKQLGIEVAYDVGGMVAGRVIGQAVYTCGGIVYPTAKAAINAALDKTPGLKVALGKVADKVIIAGEKLGQSALGKGVARVEAAIEKSALGKGVARVDEYLLKAEANAFNKVVQAKDKVLQQIADKFPQDVTRSTIKYAATSSGDIISIVDLVGEDIADAAKLVDNTALFAKSASKAKGTGNKTKFLGSGASGGGNGRIISPGWDTETIKYFENIKQVSTKNAWIKKFGNFYKDPKTGQWWSKDTAGHTGPHYKVFKETKQGFNHLFDADLLVKEIVDKHKGPTGLFISRKDIIFKS